MVIFKILGSKQDHGIKGCVKEQTDTDEKHKGRKGIRK